MMCVDVAVRTTLWTAKLGTGIVNGLDSRLDIIFRGTNCCSNVTYKDTESPNENKRNIIASVFGKPSTSI